MFSATTPPRVPKSPRSAAWAKNSGGKEAGHFMFDGFLAKVNYENPPTDATVVTKCPRKCIAEDAHFEAGT